MTKEKRQTSLDDNSRRSLKSIVNMNSWSLKNKPIKMFKDREITIRDKQRYSESMKEN